MKKTFFISTTLSLLLSIPAFAQNLQRCYFSGTYDMGYFNNTVWNIFLDQMQKKDMSSYILYSYVRVTDIPPAFLQNKDLQTLLQLRMVAIGRVLPSPAGPQEILVLQDNNFEFIRQNRDLSSYILMMYPMGDQFEVLESLLQLVPHDILLSKMRGPVDISQAVCTHLRSPY